MVPSTHQQTAFAWSGRSAAKPTRHPSDSERHLPAAVGIPETAKFLAWNAWNAWNLHLTPSNLHLTPSNLHLISMYNSFSEHIWVICLSVWNVWPAAPVDFTSKWPGKSWPWTTFAKSGFPSIEAYRTFLQRRHSMSTDSHTCYDNIIQYPHQLAMGFSICPWKYTPRWRSKVGKFNCLNSRDMSRPCWWEAVETPWHRPICLAPREGDGFANPLGARKNACSSSLFSSANAGARVEEYQLT